MFSYCEVCGRRVYSGYLVNHFEYYCNDECLQARYTEEQYDDLYDNKLIEWTSSVKTVERSKLNGI